MDPPETQCVLDIILLHTLIFTINKCIPTSNYGISWIASDITACAWAGSAVDAQEDLDDLVDEQ